MIDVNSPLVIFHDSPGADSDRENPASCDYLRRREAAERAAAKRATSVAARSLHQELAQEYARRRGKLAG